MPRHTSKPSPPQPPAYKVSGWAQIVRPTAKEMALLVQAFPGACMLPPDAIRMAIAHVGGTKDKDAAEQLAHFHPNAAFFIGLPTGDPLDSMMMLPKLFERGGPFVVSGGDRMAAGVNQACHILAQRSNRPPLVVQDSTINEVAITPDPAPGEGVEG